MNRLILTGNGFDIAHHIASSYNDFICDYWQNAIENIRNSAAFQRFENDEIAINKVPKNWIKSEKFTYHYLKEIIADSEVSTLTFKNKFLLRIMKKKSLTNWVDVENEYYEYLIQIFSKSNSNYTIKNLNRDFEQIKLLLKNYLIRIEEKFMENPSVHDSIVDSILSKIEPEDLSVEVINKLAVEEYKYVEKDFHEHKYNGKSLKDFPKDKKKLISDIDIEKRPVNYIEKNITRYIDLNPKEILFLNFNYTNTENLYLKRSARRVSSIHIHGELNEEINPIIFGYGDELDDDYLKIEKLNDNDYLENIKSIKYSETNNYQKLLNFLNEDHFQVYIFGHSCGVSDRTLLNAIFEHENCASIKPYYYIDKEGNDNYSDLTKNISRNFNSKKTMRDRVVNKMNCTTLT